MTLSEAQGFADLGMWQDAWEAIEALPGSDRATPGVLRLRLRCCAHLDGWGTGSKIAKILEGGAEADRESAARFYLALAAREVTRGGIPLAKDAVCRAVTAWPQIRLAVLDDPVLGPTLF